MAHDVAHGLELVLVPLVELALDLLNYVHRVWTLPVESFLKAAVYLFLDMLWEEAHLAAVHNQEFNFGRIRDLYRGTSGENSWAYNREGAEFLITFILIVFLLGFLCLMVLQEENTPSEVLLGCQIKECHLYIKGLMILLHSLGRRYGLG